MTTLADLPTPCLVLDRTILQRNITTMADVAARRGIPLRPHMKTAKSIDVARLALGGIPGAITVSTLAEADYFAGFGITDILYAVGITPQKLERVARLNASGARIIVLTDDPGVARLIAARADPPRTLIEIDTGEGRGGLGPDDPLVLEIAASLGAAFAGVMTHAGHSYSARTTAEITRVAEAECAGASRAAERLRQAGYPCGIVSVGSSPTALHGEGCPGATELRAGVYMFGDLFQAQIGTHALEDIAVTVLASVIGRRPDEHRLLVDAGGLALSKDRSTETAPVDYGYGLLLDAAGKASFGRSIVTRAYQEHGVVQCDATLAFPDLPIGSLVRIAPNHTCMTVAAHDRYHVLDGTSAVVATWPRINHW